MTIRLALYEPDIPQNTGTVLRLAACMSVGVDVIEPCGFVWDEKKMRRSGMDYLDHVDLTRHSSWASFHGANQHRIVLLSTKAEHSHIDFSFQVGDVLLLGRESAGVPDHVHEAASARIRIPMAPTMRSINVAVSAAMVLGEALRQLDAYPEEETVE
jgi:tRNA (cytidine/uridine-2'-O-)-methyltransferase